MADSPKKYSSPPYATFAPFMNLFTKLRDNGIPGRIDPSVFGNASGSLSYSVIAALKSLRLIEPNGTPTDEFVELVQATDEDRPALLREAMKNAYPTLHGGQFPLRNATAAQFDEHIRENYEARGSTVDKVASFFIAASEYAGLEISDLIKNRKPIASSERSKKSKRQRKSDQDESAADGQIADQQITDKALEYKLVDLMREPDVQAEERGAIWTLLQYLTARAMKKATDQ